MSNPTQQNILGACLAPSVYEKGGGYGQKGVDFQRYWAISRIIELATADEPDFLILFESLQDIAEFDHAQAPTNAKIYQLKTKDTGEWTWKALTALPIQSRKKRNSDEPTTPKAFVDSPVGKIVCSLYMNVTNLTNIAYADHLNLAQYFYAQNGNVVTVTNQRQGVFNMGRDFTFKVVFPFSK